MQLTKINGGGVIFAKHPLNLHSKFRMLRDYVYKRLEV